VLAKLNLKNPPDHMKAPILWLMGCLVLVGCKDAQVPPGESPTARPAEVSPPSTGQLYLAQRVAVATEESLYGLDAGTELKLIEERPASLLVQAEGLQFELDPRHTTRDRHLAETLLARAQAQKRIPPSAIAERWQIEDRRFLAEENLRRSAEEAHLRKSTNQPRAH
jgi:hypothetical protein